MYPDTTNQFLRQRDTAVEAAFGYTTEVVAGLEKVLELNVQTVKTSFSEQRALADAALSARSLSEVIDLQSQLLPAVVKKTFAYWQHVEDIAVETRYGLFTAVQEHFGSSLRALAEMADIASGGLAAQEGLKNVSLLVRGQPAVTTAAPVMIVDSSGKVVSSDDARRDLH
jgi:phasin family protein